MNQPCNSPGRDHGWVLYDGGCCFCTGMIRRFRKLLGHYGFKTAPLQTSWVRAQLPQGDAAPSEMIVLAPGGCAYGGADAILQIAREIWWAWPLVALAKFPGAKPVLHVLYRRLAARRHCLGGACALRSRPRHLTPNL